MSSRIPPELCDQIIDCLSDDKAALRTCGITCRSWLPRARHHLFERAAIDWTNCDSFIELLQSSDDIGHHIRAIEIEGALGVFSMDRQHTATLSAWLHSIPEDIPAKLVNVKELDLALITIDATIAAGFVARLPSLITLSLCACTLDSFNTLVEILYSMPVLQDFSVAFSEWSGGVPNLVSHSSRRRAPQLRSVEMTGGGENYIPLLWLISHSLHTTIERLSCTRMQFNTLGTLGNIISALAPSLRCLTIGFGEMPNPQGASGPFHIPPLPVLFKLMLQVDVLRSSSVFYTLFVLRHLVTPALEELHFEVRCADGAAFLGFPWKPFTELLESRHFSALTKLGFVFKLRDCSGASENELRFMQNYMENMFGRHKGKCALTFSYVQQRII